MTVESINKNICFFREMFSLDNRSTEALMADLLKRGDIKSSFLGTLSINPWYVGFISAVERLFASSMGGRIDKVEEEDFLFVSCIDPVHRVKTLPLIARDFNYSVFFLPTVTRPTIVRQYYKHYKQRSDEKVLFGTFSWGDVKKYRAFIRKNKAIINKIECDNHNDTVILREYARRFALYSIYASRVFENINNKQLWLFEHDKFFFIPIIKFFKEKGVMTTQLQHGTFINPQTDAFFPLYSDNIICSSEREKSLYLKSGVDENNIFIIGAPLQTIGQKEIKKQEAQYDLLVALTHTAPKELKLQKEVLSYIKDSLNDYSVVLRLRPRSASVDKQNLQGYIEAFKITEGTTLAEDVNSAKKVITFSLDAIYEIIRCGKEFIAFIDSSDVIDHSLDGVCVTTDTVEKSIKTLLESADIHENNQYVLLFGETDVERIRDNFRVVISDLKRSLSLLS